MVFKTIDALRTNNIDLTSAQSKQNSGNQIVSLIKPSIDGVITDVQNNNFDFSGFPFTKQPLLRSGLTGKSGLYLIINKQTKRFYLGGAGDLAQRKGDHWRSFTNPDRKLAQSMLADLQAGKPEDFCFVPLLMFTQNQVTGLGSNKTYNQNVSEFLDTYVEGPLLTNYLSIFSNLFYNARSVSIGTFMPAALPLFGGSFNSGKPREPVSYTLVDQSISYAWDSVSAMAKTFGVDPKLIRVKRMQGKVISISQADFDKAKPYWCKTIRNRFQNLLKAKP
jgi:hypothetical protein